MADTRMSDRKILGAAAIERAQVQLENEIEAHYDDNALHSELTFEGLRRIRRTRRALARRLHEFEAEKVKATTKLTKYGIESESRLDDAGLELALASQSYDLALAVMHSLEQEQRTVKKIMEEAEEEAK